MNEISWGRALKHGAIAAALLLGVGIVIAATAGHGADYRAIGQAAGKMTFWGFVGGLGVSVLWQRRGPGPAIAVTVLAVVAGLVGFGGSVGKRQGDVGPLTAKESAPLVIEGQGAARRLRHPHLGYSVALPEDLTPMPASVTQAFTSMAGVTGTAWGNVPEGRVLVLMLTTVHSEKNLRDFMKGLEDSEAKLAKQAGVDPSTIQVKRDELSWSGERGEVHRAVDIDELHVRFDGFGGRFAGGRVLTVGLYTASRGADSFAGEAATLQLD
jgi:hypothetical protein